MQIEVTNDSNKPRNNSLYMSMVSEGHLSMASRGHTKVICQWLGKGRVSMSAKVRSFFIGQQSSYVKDRQDHMSMNSRGYMSMVSRGYTKVICQWLAKGHLSMSAKVVGLYGLYQGHLSSVVSRGQLTHVVKSQLHIAFHMQVDI